MATYELFPEKERFRKAVRWLGELRVPSYTLRQVEEASREFDLSPADEDFLIRHFVVTPKAGFPKPGRVGSP